MCSCIIEKLKWKMKIARCIESGAKSREQNLNNFTIDKKVLI